MGTASRVLCLVALVAQATALVTSPPRILKQPTTEEQLYQVAQKGDSHRAFVIECEAEGEPAPKYRWIKNGKPFEYSIYDKRISQQMGRGTLYVTEPRDEDVGQYQCFAENELGTAVTNSVFLRKAELNAFKVPDGSEQSVVKAQEGAPYKLPCQPPDGWPKPMVYWMLVSDQGLNTINNSRMTLDPEGNLWFSNVTRNDASVNYAYACAAKAAFKTDYNMGNKIFLEVEQTGNGLGQHKYPPVKQYVTRKNEVAVRGKKVEIFCIYGGTPLPQTVWKKNGAAISFSQRVTQGRYGKTIVIKPVQDDDAGSYTCEVSNGVGDLQTYSVSLTVQAIPYFTVEPDYLNKAEGEDAEFRCEAAGNPPPAIKWIFNGKPIEQAPSNPRRTVKDNYIRITDLVKKDTGNYGCNATNSLGYVYKDVYVNVQAIPPEFREKPTDLTKADGSEAVMKCRVFGAPKPLIKWHKDDAEVTGGRYNITTEGDLVIREVAFTDAGMYRCYATNKFNEINATAQLVVKKRTVITDKPEQYEVAAGNTATFRCNAHADDSLHLEIIWMKQGKPIDYDEQPRFIKNNDYSLHITQTQELDSGEYTCLARTDIDEASAQATLTVQDKPNPPEVTGIECGRDTATLHWRLNGDNRARILRVEVQYNTSFTPDTWEVASDNVPSGDFTWTPSLSPWANYTFRVIARNKIGPSLPSGHSQVCSTQPEVPHKNPDQVEGKGTEPTNMRITWKAMPQIEHNGEGFYYLVSYRRNISGSQWTDTMIRDWRTTELLVPNTQTYQPYRIKVVAFNSLGSSDVAPVEVVGYSGEDVPLRAPADFKLAQVNTGTQALFTWSPVDPATLRGEFQGYKVETWTDESGDMREHKYNPQDNSGIVTDLVPYTKNYARVRVYNGRYNGPPSEVVSFVTPEGVPGPVRTFKAYPIGSSAMILKWDKPEHENGVLTGYKIYYQKMVGTDPESIQERKREIDPKFDRAKLAGLEPNTKYRIYIKAKTRAGEGQDTFVDSTTTSVETRIPDVPLFEASTLPSKPDTAHILVRWLPSLDGHSGTHFKAWYRLKNHPKWLDTPEVTDEDYTVLTGLEPRKLYEVKISAHDGEYFRESSILEVDTTDDGPTIMRPDKMASAAWYIGVMVALAFLLLVLVLVCVARRNRGGKYDVHDRELAHGRRDYRDEGFQEYTHPLDNKSRHSMSSGTKHPESDTDSMAEYGEGETGRFTEDGSFIGQYVPGARVLPPPPLPAATAPLSPPPPPPPTTNGSQQPPTYV